MERRIIKISREQLRESFNVEHHEIDVIATQEVYPLLIKYLLELYLKQKGENNNE